MYMKNNKIPIILREVLEQPTHETPSRKIRTEIQSRESAWPRPELCWKILNISGAIWHTSCSEQAAAYIPAFIKRTERKTERS
jgi:hypothetical protein